ncbi:MAG: FliM/FliN family flagellar motor switch protein [Sulfurihydrogenibium sp.]|jgi:flagellar motor switch protein FliN/FliY|uniref:FliM/FliN family flagellar motor switch protein n=1 Tax=Sulfurihydrogenibium sp. TaxID=2053621 RepID=UPI000CB67B6F|nr:MAG: flagellar motor switch protein FliN [Sulfurihydrogenibium sp.]
MITLEDIKFLKDVEVEVRVELGSIVKTFEFLLNLNEGDLIPLEKNIEDFLTIYIKNVPFAVGEIVNVNDRYGIRIIDLIKENV